MRRPRPGITGRRAEKLRDCKCVMVFDLPIVSRLRERGSMDLLQKYEAAVILVSEDGASALQEVGLYGIFRIFSRMG